MFALPYPREFLGCICLAKTPIGSSTLLIAWEISRLPPFAYNAFPVQGHLQNRRPCRWPGVSPGASLPGRCGGAGWAPTGGVCPGCVQALWLVINFLLGLGTGQNLRRKRPGVVMGQATTSSYSHWQAAGLGLHPSCAWLRCLLLLQAPWPLATVNLRGFMVSCPCGFCSPL